MSPPDVTGRGLRASLHSVVKLGRSPDENEDSAAVDAAGGRFAVADGAATSARAEVWSRILVDAYVHDAVEPCAALTVLRGRWLAAVSAPDLPWYAQAKLLRGGAATFAGLTLDAAARTYRVTAVGDSCVFHFRGADLLLAAPIADSAAFNRFPAALSTRPEDGPMECPLWTGEYRPGDVFVLATDALAKFILTRHETHRGTPPIEALRADFSRRVAGYRRRGLLGNDDTTLCVVHP
ncbi:hypothetical protein ACFO1B_49595 [Dactylosporangium siamense]|uniref:PPM-type phosphatase domain-containing protein n=1 Tax=Dactylosporangium siamense TaxID=685454 RepID=A0A919PZA5_9ACTN|nr:hypothetical protein [Dactylosporangium siamense]GIG52011.1 hypothetical protein Dsi01nite_100520 [Dactylosporangium siamense]